MAAQRHLLFVYGTLRHNRPATHFISGYEMYMCEGRTFDFPYIVEHGSEANTKVFGNLVEVDDVQLEHLDYYEGVDRGMYERVKLTAFPLHSDQTSSLEAFVYVQKSLHPRKIQSGDWLNR